MTDIPKVAPNPKPDTVKQVLAAFVASSSVKGASKVLKSKTICQRVLWSLTVLIGLTITTFQLYLLFSAFVEYNTTVTTTETTESMHFPDISVCNLNPLAATQAQRIYNPWIDSLTPVFYDVFGENVSLLEMPEWSTLTYEQQTMLTLANDEGFWQNLNQSHNSVLKTQLSNFIRECKWDQWKFTLTQNGRSLPQQQKCDISSDTYATYFFDQRYGPCVTFSLPYSVAHDMHAFTGVFYVQDIEGESTFSYKVSPDVSYGSGVKVLVHSHETLPNMADAIAAAPGFETTIFVDVTKRTRLDKPYGSCTSRERLPSEPAYGYTYESCTALCGQLHALKTCDCLAYDEVISPSLIDRADFCGKFENDFNDTVANYACSWYHYAMDPAPACTCLPPCQELTVESRASQTRWPHRMHATSFFNSHVLNKIDDYERFIESATTTFLGNFTVGYPSPNYDLLRRNFLQLTVKLQRLNMTLVADKQAMTINGVVSSIGGILNLWIGINLVTIIELADVIFELIVSRYKQWKHKRKIQNNPDNKWTIIKQDLKTHKM